MTRDEDSPPPGVVGFAPRGRRYEREYKKALVHIDRLFIETPCEEVAALRERAELRTCGALQRVSQLIEAAIVGGVQRNAVPWAMLAVAVVDLLPPIYPADAVRNVRARAWLNLGDARAALGRHDEAIEAFANAGSVLESAEDDQLEFALSVIRMSLALSYQQTGRNGEALRLLTRCARVFRDFGDTVRFEIARYHRAVLKQSLSEPLEARACLARALFFSSNLEPEVIVDLLMRIGVCSIELGEYQWVDHYLDKAIGVYVVLNMPARALRVKHECGRLLLQAGLLERALPHLETARRRYLRDSMAEEAALCGLDLVEAFLALADPDGAERLTRTINSELLVAGFDAWAIDEVASLAEKIAGGTAEPAHARQVRESIQPTRGSV